MDPTRPKDDRDSRNVGRTGFSRDRPPGPLHFSGRNSPDLPIPLRAGYSSTSTVSTSAPYQSIPLRPIGPQRYTDHLPPSLATSSSTSSNPYYRPPSEPNGNSSSTQLPPRPSQRYRSPRAGSPPSGPPSRGEWEGSNARSREGSSRGWEREEGNSSSRGWERERERDEYSSSSRSWRESDRESNWDSRDRDRDRERDRGDRGRSYDSDTGRSSRGGFEVPYRQRGYSRKRSRDSSDEDDRDDEPHRRSRSTSTRPVSPPDYRRGSLNSLPRKPPSEGSNGYAHPRFLDDSRDGLPRRPQSPSAYDSFDIQRRVSAPQLLRDTRELGKSPPVRRQRSYSPGEILEGSNHVSHRSSTPPRAKSVGKDDNRVVGSLEARMKVLPAAEFSSYATDQHQRNGMPVKPISNGIYSPSVLAPLPSSSFILPAKPIEHRHHTLSSLPIRPLPQPPPLSPPRPTTESKSLLHPLPPSSQSSASLSPRIGASIPTIHSESPAIIAKSPVVKVSPLPSVLEPVPSHSVLQPVPSIAGLSSSPPLPSTVFKSSTPFESGGKESSLHQPSTPSVLLPVPSVLFNVPSVLLPAPTAVETSIPPSSYSSTYPPPLPINNLQPFISTEASQSEILPLSSVISTAVSIPTVVSDTEMITEAPLVDSNAMEVDSVAIESIVEPILQSPSPPQPRSPSPSPSPPISPPRDFSSVLGHIILANEEDSGHVNELMELNRTKTEKERNCTGVIRDLSDDQDFFDLSIDSHERLRPFLFEDFQKRDSKRGEKLLRLRVEYKVLNDDWKAHCKRLDKIKERIHRRPTTTLPTTPSIDSSGLPFYPEPTTPGPSIVGGRANRRNTNAAFGYGDAVRSEAEFLEILASLETADLRDPNVRATRTAAIVPDMLVDDSERRDLLALEDNRRLVEDPVEFYSLQAPLDLWTEDEVQIFCKRFTQHPKQFGKISSELPEKTTAQCVLFYYRMKTTIDFRSLSDRRGRDGRRRNKNTSSRRRIDTDGNTTTGGKKGASLMSNLQRAKKTEDRDQGQDDDESPPPESPYYQSHSRYVVESPSVFQPPESTSRPPPLPSNQDSYFDDFNHHSHHSRNSSTSAFSNNINGNKKVKSTKPSSSSISATTNNSSKLLSEGTLEAAEALGAFSRSGNNNDSLSHGEEGTPEGTSADAKAAARRKASTSSYWSVAERNEFVRLLGIHGKEWNKLAKGLQNKTAVQCRNWFQNHQKKLNLADVVKNADTGDDRDASRDFTVPLGVPLSEALNVTAPRAGFFVPDGSHRSNRPTSLEIASFDDNVIKSGMKIRNILNDDTPDEETPALGGKDDWFGSGGGPRGARDGRDGDGNVSTEDEGDGPPPPTKQSPVRRQEHSYSNSNSSRPTGYGNSYGNDPRIDTSRYDEDLGRQNYYSQFNQQQQQQQQQHSRLPSLQQQQQSSRYDGPPSHSSQRTSSQWQPHQQQQASNHYPSFPSYGSPPISYPPPTRHPSEANDPRNFHYSPPSRPQLPPSQQQQQQQGNRGDYFPGSRNSYDNYRPPPLPNGAHRPGNQVSPRLQPQSQLPPPAPSSSNWR